MALVRNIQYSGGGGSGTNITVVANYSALPDPTTVSGSFYWCESAQGTSWLPGGLGGTYYNSGMYYSNGVSWSFMNVPYQATQSEVNIGSSTDKFVTPSTLAGWWTNIKSLAQTISGLWTFSNGIVLTPIAMPTYNKGQLFYDNANECLSVFDDISGTSMQLGQEQITRCRNNSGSTITNGSVVYVNGALGQNPTIRLAKADSLSTSEVIGVATHDIPNNTIGKVTAFGIVNDIDTSAFTDGDIVYLSASTAGLITSTVPSSPNYNVSVGTILHAHATQGKLLVHASRPISLNTTVGTSDKVCVSENVLKTNLDLKAPKSDMMILLNAYVGSNSTSPQKMFNVGASGNGSHNASANTTYKFRLKFNMTGLSSSPGTLSLNFGGTAVITSIDYDANVIKVATLSTQTGAIFQSIQTASSTVVTASNANTNIKGMLNGIIRVSTAGTIQPQYTTSVGSASVQTEINSFFEITPIGSDTFTASSNFS